MYNYNTIKMKNTIPGLNRLLLSSLLTLKRINNNNKHDFKSEFRFEKLVIDRGALEKYRCFFEFKSDLPLTYLYLIAQRVQISMMLDKKFPLRIPGLIQIDNSLTRYDNLDPDYSMEISAAVMVNYQEKKILTSFSINFFQKNIRVAECISTYISKRRIGNKTARAAAPDQKKKPEKSAKQQIYSEEWKLYKNTGWKYAGISGDYNPIHLFPIVSKLAGFSGPIVQGWYLVSRAAASIENTTNMLPGHVAINFKKPAYMPSTLCFTYHRNENRETGFSISNNNIILATGTVS